MAPFLFRCPNTETLVQGYSAAAPAGQDGTRYEGVECLSCGRMHMVNPATGKVRVAPGSLPTDARKRPR